MSLLVKWLESMHVDLMVTNKCARQRNTRSSCTFCSEACLYGALAINQQSIEIDSERCSSCGDCVIACPLSAIEGSAVTREFAQGYLIYKSVYTPTEKELLIYKKRGINSIQIDQTPLNQQWEVVVNNTNEMLIHLGQSPIKVVEKIKDEKLSRRAFFTSFQIGGKQLAKSITPASWKMEAGEWKLASYYPEYQFYTVELDKQKCSLCQVCFSFCSQGVFTILDTALKVEHDKCVNCTDCTDICQENAIGITSIIKEKSKTVENFYTKVCHNCGNSFHTFLPEVKKCHICINRDPEWLSPY
jgi:Fe-S-cluster-containing hydrogenase component 2